MKHKFSIHWKDDHDTNLWFKERGGGIVCQGKKWKNSAILVGIGDNMHHTAGRAFFTIVAHFLPWINKVLVIIFMYSLM